MHRNHEGMAVRCTEARVDGIPPHLQMCPLALQVKVSDTSELDSLLDAKAYEAKCEEGGSH